MIVPGVRLNFRALTIDPEHLLFCVCVAILKDGHDTVRNNHKQREGEWKI